MNALISGSPPVPYRRGAALGARRLASLGLGAVLVATQCLGSWAHAQDDARPPTIRHKPVTEVPAGGSVSVDAVVTDEGSGVAGAQLNLSIGDDYAMEPVGDDLYRGELSAKEAEPGDELSYWITATDEAGNEQSRGFEFDPFVVTVGEPDAAVVEADAGGTNWLLIVGAAASVALLAGLAAGGGSDGGSSNVDGLCCTIRVE